MLIQVSPSQEILSNRDFAKRKDESRDIVTKAKNGFYTTLIRPIK